MNISVFDLFKIGIGPSSSHTVGPMVAARRFLLECGGALDEALGLRIDLYGSLALTGVGHATDKAVLLGLAGACPDTLDPDTADEQLAHIRQCERLLLLGRHAVPFVESRDLLWHRQETLPEHPNGLRFTLKMPGDAEISRVFHSIGGGFIRAAGEHAMESAHPVQCPYPFENMGALLALGESHHLRLAEMLSANERAVRSQADLEQGLDRIAAVMLACIDRGIREQGELPGGLHVQRRAGRLWLAAQTPQKGHDALKNDAIERVSLYAMAVNEENAAGGRVVTAPTNGAAGIVPAVLRYYLQECRPTDPVAGTRELLLAAACIGMLCKKNASISGAEVGCQGEVGVACAMAAAGLTAALGGSNTQVENAAEIGIEHHLGMTCDPVGGLVQIPCIERNGMGAVKSITAATLALTGDGKHYVSLDQAIETMRQTGCDMQSKYKETALGGLAIVTVNRPAC